MKRNWIQQNIDKSMEIRTLYKDKEVTLQQLFIKIGDCSMTKYREIRRDENGDLGVNEVKEPPIWFLRKQKLKSLGI